LFQKWKWHLGGGGLGVLLSLICLYGVCSFQAEETVRLSQAEAAYAKVMKYQADQQSWQEIEKNHQSLWQRLLKIQQTSQVGENKIRWLVSQLAISHGLSDTALMISPLQMSSPLKGFTCTLQGKAVTDKSVFDFIQTVMRGIPNVPLITGTKIERLRPLTQPILRDIVSKKPTSLVSFCVTFQWLYVDQGVSG
jgi:hypothetical protein